MMLAEAAVSQGRVASGLLLVAALIAIAVIWPKK